MNRLSSKHRNEDGFVRREIKVKKATSDFNSFISEGYGSLDMPRVIFCSVGNLSGIMCFQARIKAISKPCIEMFRPVLRSQDVHTVTSHGLTSRRRTAS